MGASLFRDALGSVEETELELRNDERSISLICFLRSIKVPSQILNAITRNVGEGAGVESESDLRLARFWA